MKRIDPQRYHALVPLKAAVEDALLGLPGVTGVDVGYKEVGGEQTDDMAIIVFVGEKRSVPDDERVPAEIQGVKTDVIQATFVPLGGPSAATVGTGPALDPNRYDPVEGGCSAAPARINNWYGSIGVPVRDNASGQQRILSNWHVFCDDPNWQRLDLRITQPAVVLGGDPAKDTIGNVVAARLGQIVIDWGYDWYVDCAICDASGRAASPRIIQIGALRGSAEPVVGDLLRKYGATSQYEWGVVVSTNVTVVVPYPGYGNVKMYYQYRIEPPDPTMPNFSVPGDSGSLAVDMESNAVAQIFAGDEAARYTIATPMYMVLGALNISLDR